MHTPVTHPLTIGEAAAAIGVTPSKLVRAYRLGRLPEPVRLGHYRALTADDVERARQHFAAAPRS